MSDCAQEARPTRLGTLIVEPEHLAGALAEPAREGLVAWLTCRLLRRAGTSGYLVAMPRGLVHVVDDDALVLRTTADVLDDAGYVVRTYGSGDTFLADADLAAPSCVVLDLRMPGMSGEAVLAELAARQAPIGVVIVSGHANIPVAVRAMQAGAVNVIQKPWKTKALLDAVADAMAGIAAAAVRARANELIATLTPRERSIIEALAAHGSNPRAATALGISVRTVDWHRANVKKRLGAASTADMLRLYFEATRGG